MIAFDKAATCKKSIYPILRLGTAKRMGPLGIEPRTLFTWTTGAAGTLPGGRRHVAGGGGTLLTSDILNTLYH